MDWLRENWFWILVFALFIWIHMKMHGGHGRHGGSGGHAPHGGPGEHGRAQDEEKRGDREEENHARH